MGSCVSKNGPGLEGQTVENPVNGSELMFIVVGAKNLKEGDPYVRVRIGNIGTEYDEKPEATEHSSEVVFDSSSPEWNFPVRLLLAHSPHTLEVHVQVRDKDLFTPDDPYGEVRIPAQTLIAKDTLTKEFELSQGNGSVRIIIGDKVKETVFENLKKQVDDDGWFDKGFFNSLGANFMQDVDFASYIIFMLKFTLASKNGPSGFKDYISKWAGKTKDGEQKLQKEGPLPNTITYNGYVECKERMSKLAEQLGTNNEDGQVYRENFLGFNRLNSKCWPELGDKSMIGLGYSQEDHALVRPLIDKLVGPNGNWQKEAIKQAASKFWEGRTKFSPHKDFSPFIQKQIHKAQLSLDLTDEEAADFCKFQSSMLIAIGVPDQVVDLVWNPVLKGDKLLEERKKWLAKYETALKAMWPEEVAKLSPSQLDLVKSSLMDSALFAGGQSVKTVLYYCFNLLFGEWGRTNVPEKARELSEDNLWSFVLEVVRRFPPVAGFVYRHRSTSPNTPDQRTILNLSWAQRDPAVWDDPDGFVMRPLSEYHEKSIGWAEMSDSKDNSSNNHSCPGKDFSLVLITELMRAFFLTCAEDGKVNTEKWTASLKPEEIKINEIGGPTFELELSG